MASPRIHLGIVGRASPQASRNSTACSMTPWRDASIGLMDARRLVERFVRGRSAQRTTARGTGIGLSPVNHIAPARGDRSSP